MPRGERSEQLWCVILLGILLVAAMSVAAQESLSTKIRSQSLPPIDDTTVRVMPPEVQPSSSVATPPHAFWDRDNILLFSGIAVTRGMDYASTRNMQARGRKEILLAPEVVNNSAAFASLEAAGTMTSLGISYILHRTGHHKLERWLSIGHISVTVFGDIRNYCLESKHHPTAAVQIPSHR